VNTGNKISFTIVACTVLLALITLATSFLQMTKPSTVAALPTAQAVLQPTSQPNAQNFAKELPVQWEYISLNYWQRNSYDSDAPLYDVVAFNRTYEGRLTQILSKDCSIDILYVDDDVYQGYRCAAKNYKGREYFFNVLGQDGWELITLDNTSDQTTYSVDALFKRPIR
jgi:hypothetical protein